MYATSVSAIEGIVASGRGAGARRNWVNCSLCSTCTLDSGIERSTLRPMNVNASAPLSKVSHGYVTTNDNGVSACYGVHACLDNNGSRQQDSTSLPMGQDTEEETDRCMDTCWVWQGECVNFNEN